MKILVMSDVHGDRGRARHALLTQTNAEAVIFCGDGESDMEAMKPDFPEKSFYMVRGNCDWGSQLNTTEVLCLDGVKIFFTHGHMYNAKMGEYDMKCAARAAGAQILIYGHTHNAVTDYDDGLYVMNPGACSGYGASYGIIEIVKGNILTNIIHIN